MSRFGLETLVINGDTYLEAQQNGRNLWTEAQTGYTMLLLSPEELRSQGFFRLLEHPKFYERIAMLGVDEVHLIHWWGKSFRPSFMQVGTLRPRLPVRKSRRTPLIAVTATLRIGEVMDTVCKNLGLVAGRFHFVRRSNMRHDIQLVFREMPSMNGLAFSELQWVLAAGQDIIIFAKTISLSFRVAAYLWRKAKGIPNRDQRIRLFNSLNWPEYNDETLGFLNNHTDASILIATDSLSVGWDNRRARIAVLVDENQMVADVDEYVQKIGRIGRDRSQGLAARAYYYHSHAAMVTASKLVQDSEDKTEQGKTQSRAQKGGTEGVAMDMSIARLLTASCKTRELDKLYGNPKEDVPCSTACTTCILNPPIARPTVCNCSGTDCQPEIMIPTGPARAKPTIKRPRGEGMNKDVRAHGTKQLQDFREQVFNEVEDRGHSHLPPDEFLPDETIKVILDHFHLIQKSEDLVLLIEHIKLLKGFHLRLWELCTELRNEFAEIRLQQKASRAAKSLVGGGLANSEQDFDSDESDSDVMDNEVADITGVTETVEGEEIEAESRSGIRWRINTV